MNQNVKLRFASYNIYHGGKAGYDMSKIAKNIIDNEIDVVGIQEVDRMTARSGGIDILIELSRATGYEHYAFFKTMSFDGGEYGTAILSRYPILESEKIFLESGNSEQRALGRATVDVGGRRISFFVTHLTFDSENIRKGQLVQLTELLKGEEAFVLSGDFNTSDLGALDECLGVSRINKKDAPTVTFPEDEIAIDNIVYSNRIWRFGDINTVTDSYSDHYMIWAEAEIVE
jgi:endonuclease/exonuclease/phosphatase family metal-dependent hydrolase